MGADAGIGWGNKRGLGGWRGVEEEVETEIKALGSGMGFTAIWEQDMRPQARGKWGVEREPPA